LSNGMVYEWDHPDEQPIYYTWRSKEFDAPKPVNFGACIIKAEATNTDFAPSELSGEQRAWNERRIQRPLNPIGYTPVGGSRWAMTPTLGSPDFNSTPEDELEGVDRRQYPTGGSPLWFLGIRPGGGFAFFRVFADRRLVATLVVQANQIMRLPSGFKAHFWQFELISNANTYSIAVAETGKELMDV